MNKAKFDKVKWLFLHFVFTLFFVLFSAFYVTISAYAAVTAEVDRLNVAEGGSLRLSIRTDSDSGTEPNIIPLQRNFTIRSSGKSKQTSFINGQVRSYTEWIYTISPKQAGRLVIPALTVGSEKTSPIDIVVSKAGSSAGSSKVVSSAVKNNTSIVNPGFDVFMESAVNVKKAYEGSQVLYVVRLFSGTDIESGTWPNPSIPNALTEKIGEDLIFQDTRSGKIYNVIERRYAVFPEKSGELVLPSSEFTGTVFSSAPSSNIMQIGFGALNAFFNTSEPVKVRSDVLAVEVLPKPEKYKGKWWLPAYDVNLNLSLNSSEQKFKVNEAIEVVLEIKASGLAAALLPDITLPDIPNTRVYPSKSEKTNGLDEKGIVGKITKTFVLIPQKSGKFTIPAISVDWWNLTKQTSETSGAKQQEFVVESDTANVNQDSRIVNNDGKGSTEHPATKPEGMQKREPISEKNDFHSQKIIILVTTVISFLIVFTCFILYKREKNPLQSETQQDTVHDSFKFLEKELNAPEPNSKKIAENLLAWARKYFKNDSIFNVSQIGELLGNKELTSELHELNKSVYSQDEGNFDGQLLLKALKEAISDKKQREKEVKPVPDLYPDYKV